VTSERFAGFLSTFLFNIRICSRTGRCCPRTWIARRADIAPCGANPHSGRIDPLNSISSLQPVCSCGHRQTHAAIFVHGPGTCLARNRIRRYGLPMEKLSAWGQAENFAKAAICSMIFGPAGSTAFPSFAAFAYAHGAALSVYLWPSSRTRVSFPNVAGARTVSALKTTANPPGHINWLSVKKPSKGPKHRGFVNFLRLMKGGGGDIYLRVKENHSD